MTTPGFHDGPASDGPAAHAKGDGGTTPLLPALSLPPAVEAHLRQSLTVLRDQAADPAVRRHIDDVLAGRARLRELAGDHAFGEMMQPLVTAGARQWQDRSAEEVARAERGAEAIEQGHDPVAAMGLPDPAVPDGEPTPPPPASHGTW